MGKSTSNNAQNTVDQIPTKQDEVIAHTSGHAHIENRISHVDEDTEQMRQIGYLPELKRDFSFWQLLGCAFTVTNAPLGLTGGFSTGVAVGGSACVVYGLLLVALFNVAIAVSLGELTSAFPNAGGQYYWSMRLAPKRLVRLSGYFCGICNLMGGLVATSSSVVSPAYFILGSVKLVRPDFTIQSWMVFLIAVTMNVLCGIGNLSKAYMTKNGILGLYCSLLLFVLFAVVPASVSPAHADASFIFASTTNISGWTTPAMAFFSGMINSNYCFGLIDTAVHLAEEIRSPEKIIPKILLLIVVTSLLTAWPLAVSLLSCFTDYDAIVGSDTGVPLLYLLYLSLQKNYAAAIVMGMVVVITYGFCVVSLHTYLARVCWAFSRDQGLPWSNLLAKLNSLTAIPVNAHIACVAMSSLLCILPVASTTAFNSLISGVVIFPYLSIMVPVTYSLLPGNQSMGGQIVRGTVSIIAKCVSVIYILFTLIVYSFPYYMPATSSNMNYFSAVFGVVLLLGFVDWMFRARHRFGMSMTE